MSDNNETTGKGRATPSRKDSEAARKQALKIPSDKKAAKAAMRERDYSARLEMRRALYTNDEKYLPLRDRGAVRRFVRTFVDRRVSVGELFVPFAFLILISLFVANATFQLVVTSVWMLMFVALFVDALILAFRLRRALARELPNESARGAVFYGITRSITLRSMRLPKPIIKVGGAPRTVKLPKSLQK